MEDVQEIICRLDVMLAREKMTLKELSALIDVHLVNLSIMKNGRGKAIRYVTLLRICTVLKCTPNDLFEIRPKNPDPAATAASPEPQPELTYTSLTPLP